MNYLTNIPKEHRPDCVNCPFSKDGQPQHKPVLGIRPPPGQCSGVLVGEGPGAEEVSQDEPFVGKTGEWLKARLEESLLQYDDFAILNATACQPPRGMKTDTNMGQAAHACYRLFHWQWEPYAHARKPMLAMGKWAGHAVNTGSTVTVDTGRGFVRTAKWGQWLLTWHPTYAAFYNPWKAGEFINDVQRFRRLIHNTLEKPPKTIIRPTVQDLTQLIAKSGGTIAVDIETRAPHGQPSHLGKDPTRADLRTIAFGTPNLGIAYWWGSDSEVQKYIIQQLQNPKLQKVFHNGWFFDLRVLQRYHIHTINVIDTRDMRRAVSATSRLSLRFLASVYSDFAPWKEDEK